MSVIELKQAKVFEFKFGDRLIKVNQPGTRMVRELHKQVQGKEELEQADVFVNALDKLGFPKDISDALPSDEFAKVIEVVFSTKKN